MKDPLVEYFGEQTNFKKLIQKDNLSNSCNASYNLLSSYSYLSQRVNNLELRLVTMNQEDCPATAMSNSYERIKLPRPT
jgi:hypothetical protein